MQSYRKRTAAIDPIIDFDVAALPYIKAETIIHPLLNHPVGNDIHTKSGVLLTGSNASGKSTFLKAVAINAILAQSIASVLCSSYRATSFHMYTSMALRDDIVSGDSYFIAEIKSLKRIIDACKRGERVLAIIDEIFRGTNTKERIAAAGAYLTALRNQNTLCFAATHDIELCEALYNEYDMWHFREAIENRDVKFDYLLRSGTAQTTNAIKLMEVMGFDESIIAHAQERVDKHCSE